MGYAVPSGCEQDFPAMSRVLLALQSQGPPPVPPWEGQPVSPCLSPGRPSIFREQLLSQMGDLPFPQLR